MRPSLARPVTAPAPRIAAPLPVRVAVALCAALVVALVVTLASAAPASAHAELLGSDPADGSELAALPEVVVLSYNEEIAPQYVDAAALPPGGEPVTIETSTAGGEVRAAVGAAVPVAEPGDWQLVVRVVSVDGHPVESRVGFTIASSAGGTSPEGDSPRDPGTLPGSSEAGSSPGLGTSSEPDTTPDPGAASGPGTATTGAPLDAETPGAVAALSPGLAVAGVVAAGLAVLIALGLLVARSRLGTGVTSEPGASGEREPGPGGEAEPEPGSGGEGEAESGPGGEAEAESGPSGGAEADGPEPTR